MARQAGKLGCPSCGAPAAHDARRCGYCDSPLATAACPSCFASVFRGTEHCHHCGAATTVPEQIAEAEPCPRCSELMHHKRLGETQVSECSGCGGFWVEAQAFERICADHERQAAVIAAELPPPFAAAMEGERFYMHCPICNRMLSRTNFASESGVVIDICKRHGVWFDRDELRRVVQFLRAGGMDQMRKRQMQKLQHEREKLERMQSEPASILSSRDTDPFSTSSNTVDLIQLAGTLVRFLVR